jgi:hypothetical protein
MNDSKDAFDLWWAWAEKPPDSPLTIPAEIHEAVMALPPEERRDREKVNEAVRDCTALGPLRPAGTAGPIRRSESDGIIENPLQLRRRFLSVQ